MHEAYMNATLPDGFRQPCPNYCRRYAQQLLAAPTRFYILHLTNEISTMCRERGSWGLGSAAGFHVENRVAHMRVARQSMCVFWQGSWIYSPQDVNIGACIPLGLVIAPSSLHDDFPSLVGFLTPALPHKDEPGLVIFLVETDPSS